MSVAMPLKTTRPSGRRPAGRAPRPSAHAVEADQAVLAGVGVAAAQGVVEAAVRGPVVRVDVPFPELGRVGAGRRLAAQQPVQARAGEALPVGAVRRDLAAEQVVVDGLHHLGGHGPRAAHRIDQAVHQRGDGRERQRLGDEPAGAGAAGEQRGGGGARVDRQRSDHEARPQERRGPHDLQGQQGGDRAGVLAAGGQQAGQARGGGRQQRHPGGLAAARAHRDVQRLERQQGDAGGERPAGRGAGEQRRQGRQRGHDERQRQRRTAAELRRVGRGGEDGCEGSVQSRQVQGPRGHGTTAGPRHESALRSGENDAAGDGPCDAGRRDAPDRRPPCDVARGGDPRRRGRSPLLAGLVRRAPGGPSQRQRAGEALQDGCRRPGHRSPSISPGAPSCIPRRSGSPTLARWRTPACARQSSRAEASSARRSSARALRGRVVLLDFWTLLRQLPARAGRAAGPRGALRRRPRRDRRALAQVPQRGRAGRAWRGPSPATASRTPCSTTPSCAPGAPTRCAPGRRWCWSTPRATSRCRSRARDAAQQLGRRHRDAARDARGRRHAACAARCRAVEPAAAAAVRAALPEQARLRRAPRPRRVADTGHHRSCSRPRRPLVRRRQRRGRPGDGRSEPAPSARHRACASGRTPCGSPTPATTGCGASTGSR